VLEAAAGLRVVQVPSSAVELAAERERLLATLGLGRRGTGANQKGLS